MREHVDANYLHYAILPISLALLTCFARAQITVLEPEINVQLPATSTDSYDVEAALPITVSSHDRRNVVLDERNPTPEVMTTSKPEGTSRARTETADLDGNAVLVRAEDDPKHVEWTPLMLHSNLFLGIMHGFRIATEPSTREGLHNSVVGGYFKALGAMHGWSDGDGYYENYLGHPMQGAASGYLWLNHDPRYQTAEFGLSRDYWMGRLRAMGFAWAFSEQFEIGLISEASIGQIQRYCCAYGFVDHIITPSAGLGWIVGEDIIDRYVTRKIEDHTRNRVIRMIARVGLNPPQSFANVITFHAPWHRTNRPGILAYNGEGYVKLNHSPHEAEESPVPKFELAAELPGTLQWNGGSCLGGSAVGAMKLTDTWQWTLQVGGCSMRNMPRKWSGDSLAFTTGPQWIWHTDGRWSPHAHVRFGGQKITQEYLDPDLKETALSDLPPGKKSNSVHGDYTKDFETTGFSISVGGGLDFALNRALAVRVGNVEYVRSWLGHLNGADFDRGFRLSTGIVLRIGTW